MDKQVKAAGSVADGRRALGKHGEETGAAWLGARGMRIVERNYRCRLGEIDLVGEIDETLVFVEIRSRSSDNWGTPAESVNYRKQRKLRQLAAWYLGQSGREGSACRFDVLSLLFDEGWENAKIEWIRDAF